MTCPAVLGLAVLGLRTKTPMRSRHIWKIYTWLKNLSILKAWADQVGSSFGRLVLDRKSKMRPILELRAKMQISIWRSRNKDAYGIKICPSWKCELTKLSHLLGDKYQIKNQAHRANQNCLDPFPPFYVRKLLNFQKPIPLLSIRGSCNCGDLFEAWNKKHNPKSYSKIWNSIV